MKKNRLPFRINLVLFLVTLFLNLMTQWDPKCWEGFGDAYNYLQQSRMSIFSKDFYFNTPGPGFYPRPFTVPLFYKIAGGNPLNIVQMQKFMHTLASFILTYGFLLIFTRGISKYFMMFSIYFLMSWWNILGWTTQLLSESLSTSFLFLWMGTLLISYKKRGSGWLAFHMVITLLFSFTRDSWPYFLLCFYALVVITGWIWERSFLKPSVIMLLLVIVIFFIQERSAEIGQHAKVPVINNIVLRIMPVPENFNWFVTRGMPMASQVKQKFTGLDLKKSPDVEKLYSLYTDPVFKPFLDWSAEKGQSTYTRFLLTHPSYTFLIDEPHDKLKRIFSYNLHYVSGVNGYCMGAEKVFPLFPPLVLVILTLLLILIFIFDRKLTTILPVIFVIVFIINIIVIYNADSIEVPRHIFITMVMVQFLSLWAVALLIDRSIQKISTFFKGKEDPASQHDQQQITQSQQSH